jgi:hypothetical protein
MGSASTVGYSYLLGTESGNYTKEYFSDTKTSTGSIALMVSNRFLPGTTYYFLAKATGDGSDYGDELSFTTWGPLGLPSVSTGGANSINWASANLTGNLSSKGSAYAIGYSFEWGIESGVYTKEYFGSSTTITGSIARMVSDRLLPGTTYYYRVKATGDGTVVGSERTLSTWGPLCPPSADYEDANNVSFASANLRGSLSSKGSAYTIGYSFQLGTQSGNYTKEYFGDSITSTGILALMVSDRLLPGTTYYYRVKATGDGTAIGSERSFTTWGPLEPSSVSMLEIAYLDETSVQFSGSVTDMGSASAVGCSIQLGNYPNIYSYEVFADARYSNGSVSLTIEDLLPGTFYSYRIKGVGDGVGYNEGGEFYTANNPANHWDYSTSTTMNSIDAYSTASLQFFGASWDDEYNDWIYRFNVTGAHAARYIANGQPATDYNGVEYVQLNIDRYNCGSELILDHIPDPDFIGSIPEVEGQHHYYNWAFAGVEAVLGLINPPLDVAFGWGTLSFLAGMTDDVDESYVAEDGSAIQYLWDYSKSGGGGYESDCGQFYDFTVFVDAGETGWFTQTLGTLVCDFVGTEFEYLELGDNVIYEIIAPGPEEDKMGGEWNPGMMSESEKEKYGIETIPADQIVAHARLLGISPEKATELANTGKPAYFAHKAPVKIVSKEPVSTKLSLSKISAQYLASSFVTGIEQNPFLERKLYRFCQIPMLSY